MIHFSHEKLKQLMKIPENKKCFDCENISCQWASINNGIFLCTNCSGIHRGLGVDKSYIRSIVWDNWTESQIEFMIHGGNKQLKELLKAYSFDQKSLTTQQFYQTKLMDFYRKYLKSKVDGINFEEEPPSKEEAFKESNLNLDYNNENKFSSISSINQSKDIENNISFQDNIKNWIGKAYEGTKNTINELEIGNKISYAGNAIINTGNKIIENAKIKNFVKTANDNISYYFNWIIGTNKNINTNPDNQYNNSNLKNLDSNIYNKNTQNNNPDNDISNINYPV